jgi:hypothetical protein
MPAGFKDNLPRFSTAETSTVVEALKRFVAQAGDSQVRAWKDSIPPLMREAGRVSDVIEEYRAGLGSKASAILEYEVPLEGRRIDAVFLLNGAIAVIELKGKDRPTQADLDQAAAYARDLRAYHADCENLPVACVLIPTRAKGFVGRFQGVEVMGPEMLAEFCAGIERVGEQPPVDPETFLLVERYRPLPSLVKAARELFITGDLARIKRAAAATDPTVHAVENIVKETARRGGRALILVSGVPGAGKTLVGLRLAHAHYLDDLSVDRGDGKPPAPAVFLSGNGPLVQVLQYELKSAGGDGKAFVRGVHDYVKTFYGRRHVAPPHHVLIYDEAQRAFDSAQVAEKHPELAATLGALSEPELFVRFAEQVPEWSVLVGLIGTGQEIHIGEEGGIKQWADAIGAAERPDNWTIYLPSSLKSDFGTDQGLAVNVNDDLSLDRSIRFHLAEDLYKFVHALIDGKPDEASPTAKSMEVNGYHLRITRDLNSAKSYLRERYTDHPESRFGVVASSKDKALKNHGVDNSFQATRNVKFGPWYADLPDSDRSCCAMTSVVTEFGAQGLELDSALLAWGTDFRRVDGKWTNRDAGGYRHSHRIKDALQLRKNAYRVLLTRGREATVVFVPQIPELDATYEFLLQCGFLKLS